MHTDVLLAAAGTLRRSYEDVDWAATPVGPVSSWSPALRNAVDLALNTQFPVTLLWGAEFVLVYNEAYVPLIADKHPAALGAPARDVFPEAWATIGPLLESVLAGEGATWVEDAPVPLHRRGRLEEAYFTFSYSPVRGPGGVVEGVMDIATETTRQVIDRRRLGTLNELRELLAEFERIEEIEERALPLLRRNGEDLPEVEVRRAAAADHAGEAPRADGVARLPVGSAPDGAEQLVLVVRLSEHLAPDEAYLGFLRLVASSLGQAIDRLAAREAERDVANTERRISEAMQRSLLTPPLQPDHLQIAVRYLPAAAQAHVGGDWYDAFMRPDGTLAVAVGDVTGHDRWAAAAMAQVRNLLRGVSYTLGRSPAEVFTALDEAMHGLAVGVFATAVVAQVEEGDADDERGARTLRWSNAGHPPPVLVSPNGRARLLETPPDVLLGLGAGKRADHTVALEPGASLVLYTDGLVERRDAGLQERFEWLVGVLDGAHRLTAEEVCDLVLAQLEDGVDDDVALLVLRAHREDLPRPAEAGPQVLPADVRRDAR